MVKLLKLGKPKREKRYFQTQCPFCESVLALELEDVWFDDPQFDLARITCPVCRTRFNFTMTDHEYDPYIHRGYPAREITEEVYLSASIDTSKSGLEQLMEERRHEQAEKEAKA